MSPGRAGLREPAFVLDCQNSGTTFRLTAGILAGLPGFAVLDGDASLRSRPMGRVAAPLSEMGAVVVDPELGVVSFEGALADGAPVHLCWKLGEAKVRYYYLPGTGYGDRRRIPAAAKV